MEKKPHTSLTKYMIFMLLLLTSPAIAVTYFQLQTSGDDATPMYVRSNHTQRITNAQEVVAIVQKQSAGAAYVPGQSNALTTSKYKADSTGIDLSAVEGTVKSMLRKLKAAGYDKYAACGVIGNMYGESGVVARCTQKHANDDEEDNDAILVWHNAGSGRAVGIVQYDGGRVGQMIAEANAQHVKWYDTEFQLNYVINDMPGQNCKTTQFNGQASIEDATWYFLLKFERPGTVAECGENCITKCTHGPNGEPLREHQASYQKRCNAAQKCLEMYGDYYDSL